VCSVMKKFNPREVCRNCGKVRKNIGFGYCKKCAIELGAKIKK